MHRTDCNPCAALFVCPCCQQACDSVQELEVHVRMRHHTCRYCREPFNTIVELNQHKANAHHICRHCQHDFESQLDLDRHVQLAHTCGVCNKKFPRDSDLAMHLARIHPGYKPHTCEAITKVTGIGEPVNFRQCTGSIRMNASMNQSVGQSINRRVSQPARRLLTPREPPVCV